MKAVSTSNVETAEMRGCGNNVAPVCKAEAFPCGSVPAFFVEAPCAVLTHCAFGSAQGNALRKRVLIFDREEGA